MYAISRLLDFPCYIFFPIVPIPFSPNLQYAFTCHLANQSAAAGSFGYTLSTLLCRYTLQAGSSNDLSARKPHFLLFPATCMSFGTIPHSRVGSMSSTSLDTLPKSRFYSEPGYSDPLEMAEKIQRTLPGRLLVPMWLFLYREKRCA